MRSLNLPFRWIFKIFRKRLWGLDILISLILIIFFHLNIGLLVILAYQEKYINNQYLVYKGIIWDLVLKPINPKMYFLISNVISLVFVNMLYLIYVIISQQFNNLALEIWRINFILILLLSVGNQISNSSISFRFVFMGIPVLRPFIYFTLLSCFTFLSNLILNLDSLLIITAITLSGLVLLKYSIQSQREIKYKHHLIYLNSLTYD
jgi:hypothetical protein